MYTIGQLAEIIGISKDKLRYYEEKGILTPIQDEDNNYRQYDFKDIDTVLAIEFYRSLDLGFKTIKRLHKQSSIKDIESILNKKHCEVLKEIDRLKTIVNRIEKAKKGCNDIEKYLNKYVIKSMKPIKILGEISDFRAYNEFEQIHKNRDELADSSIVKSLIRYISFNDEGIESSKMYISKAIMECNIKGEDDILEFDKCLYTIIEDGIGHKNVMEETFIKSKEWIYRNDYKHKGIAIISMLLIEYQETGAKSYLEVYIPIEK